jgi:hypothetical protein
MDLEVLTALIAAAVSLVVAIGGALYGRRNAHELERLKAQLDADTKEKDAFRDYQYEARKRLYQECEPLLFSLTELSENALGRIKGLVRAARDGELRDSPEGWLSRPDDYYFTSTLYRLMAPVAVHKILRQRLTSVDLTVDGRIQAQYELGKLLYRSFRDDYGLARMTPPLPYDPNRLDARARLIEEPQVFWRQGVVWGRLDDALDAMTPSAGEAGPQLMSYGRFENQYRDDAEFRERFRDAAVPLVEFHPRTRPVFWRMLVAHAYVYETFLRVHRLQPGAHGSAPLAEVLPELNADVFDWRENGANVADEEVRQPLSAARAYVADYLTNMSGRLPPALL